MYNVCNVYVYVIEIGEDEMEMNRETLANEESRRGNSLAIMLTWWPSLRFREGGNYSNLNSNYEDAMARVSRGA